MQLKLLDDMLNFERTSSYMSNKLVSQLKIYVHNLTHTHTKISNNKNSKFTILFSNKDQKCLFKWFKIV